MESNSNSTFDISSNNWNNESENSSSLEDSQHNAMSNEQINLHNSYIEQYQSIGGGFPDDHEREEEKLESKSISEGQSSKIISQTGDDKMALHPILCYDHKCEDKSFLLTQTSKGEFKVSS